MLTALTTGVRLRVATLVAALAIFSFVAPPMALAFAPSKTAVHCLSRTDHEFAPHGQAEALQPGSIHDHEDHAEHSHGDRKSACCCLFSVTALVPDSGDLSEPELSRSAAFSAIEASFHGFTPDRLNRPPISLLSL